MTDKTVKIYEILYLENRIPKIEKNIQMEVTAEAGTSIRLAVNTVNKKDKTSEAVIRQMTETKNETEMTAKATARKRDPEPVTLYR